MKEIKYKAENGRMVIYAEGYNKLFLDRQENIDKKELIQILKFNNDIGIPTFGDIAVRKKRNGKYILENGHKTYKITKMNYLPLLHKDWEDIVKTKNEKSFEISNYGLAIDKFSRFTGKTLDYIAYNGGDNLYHRFDKIIGNQDKSILKYAQAKQKKRIKKLESKYDVGQIEIQQNWRLALHLGSATAFNNGFLLHPVYGIPYLSDTAIKGMLRSYVVENYFDFDEDKALKSRLFVCIFGEGNDQDKSIGKQGKVTFLPAFPTNEDFSVEADVMNPHNSNYYGSNNKYPTDTENPTPIKFITLKKAVFQPAFFIKKGSEACFSDTIAFDKAFNGKTLMETVSELMLKAFELKGIGAKTNKAYGRLFPKEKLEKKKQEMAEKQKNLMVNVIENSEKIKDVKKVNKEITKGDTKTKTEKKQITVQIPNYNKGNLILNGEIKAVISSEDKKKAKILVDNEEILCQLVFAKWIDKNNYEVNQIVKAKIQQLNLKKSHIQLKIE